MSSGSGEGDRLGPDAGVGPGEPTDEDAAPGSDGEASAPGDPRNPLDEIHAAFDPHPGGPTLMSRALGLAPRNMDKAITKIALRGQVHPNDPAWVILISAGLAQRWQQQILKRMSGLRDSETKQVRTEIALIREHMARAREVMSADMNELRDQSTDEIMRCCTKALTSLADARIAQTKRAQKDLREAVTMQISQLSTEVDAAIRRVESHAKAQLERSMKKRIFGRAVAGFAGGLVVLIAVGVVGYLGLDLRVVTAPTATFMSWYGALPVDDPGRQYVDHAFFVWRQRGRH